MIKVATTICVFLLIAFTSLAAQAQATRTWVSGVGDDVNPCSRTAPCKTFAGAIMKTAAGGEIDVLDPGGFGSVIISKSITIDGTGMLSSVLASSVNGITINITDVKDKGISNVRLRGLSINGFGTGVSGINIVEARTVTVEDCVIDGFKTNGINVGAGRLFVRNTTIRHNANAGIAIKVGTQVGLADVALVFNGVGIQGAARSLGNVYLFGNATGDPP